MPSRFVPHDGLLLLGHRDLHTDYRALAREVAHGHLVKLRRGAYVERDLWAASDSRGQHLLRVRSVLAVARRPAIVSGLSAAAVHGMPIAGIWPDAVSLLDEWGGGGRSEPGVRRSAAGFATAERVIVDGYPVTTLARTALDVARPLQFRDALGSVDWALWRGNTAAVTKTELWDELETSGFRAGRRSLAVVLDFATHLSDSMGESECRAVIHELGFEAPELQVVFVDDQGRMEPDFLWPSVRRFGEFDGKMKYTRARYNRGDPAEVVWQEKKREDRLRKKGLSGIRILTEHVRRPARLEALLLEAGVPRRVRARGALNGASRGGR